MAVSIGGLVLRMMECGWYSAYGVRGCGLLSERPSGCGGACRTVSIRVGQAHFRTECRLDKTEVPLVAQLVWDLRIRSVVSRAYLGELDFP